MPMKYFTKEELQPSEKTLSFIRQIRRYNQTADTLSHEGTTLTPLPDFASAIADRTTENLLYVGGQITKHHALRRRGAPPGQDGRRVLQRLLCL